MSKSSRKKLIVSGCSHTDLNFCSSAAPHLDTSYNKWPEIVAEKLDMDLICSARSGASNDGIFNKTITDIFNNDNIGCVMVLWTQAIRFELYNSMRFNPSTIVPKMDDINTIIRKNAVQYNYMLRHSVNFYLNHIKVLSKICERLNIPLIMGQHSDFLTLYATASIEKDGIKRSSADLINEIYHEMFVKKVLYMKTEGYDFDHSRFIGWPILKNLGGKSMKNIIYDLGGDEIFLHRTLDRHPSKRGHELIAEVYLQKYIDDYLQDKI